MVVSFPSKQTCSFVMYTWNPDDPCFEWKGPSFGGFKPQNRGQTGSRYMNIMYIPIVFVVRIIGKATFTSQPFWEKENIIFRLSATSRCCTTTWPVKVRVQDLQWYVTKTPAAKRDKMWMWPGASSLRSGRDWATRVGLEITIFFVVEDCWWAKKNSRKSMDMANFHYWQCFIYLIWSTGFRPQLVAADHWKSFWVLGGSSHLISG